MADWAQLCDWCTLIVASEIIQSISDEIIYHAVEEEARLMRVIMHKAKEESAEFVKIIQEHNWVMNFLKNRIIMIKKASASSNPDEHEQAKDDLNEFVSNLIQLRLSSTILANQWATRFQL